MFRYSEHERDAFRRFYARETARKIRNLERLAASQFDAHVVVSERDGEQLRRINPRARVFVVENGVDSAYYSTTQDAPAPIKRPSGNSTAAHLRNEPQSPRRRLIFVGSMNYHANIEAVLSFSREVWPSIHQLQPDLVFTIVGRDPSTEVRQLSSIPGIEVTGTVDDVRPFYREAVAAVVPLRVGGGSRLKILEAMAAGVPVISTTLGAEGIDVRHGENILIANGDSEIRDCVLSLVRDEASRETLCVKARALVTERYEWSHLGARLAAIHQSLNKELDPTQRQKLKLLAIVEATTVNAVAKNMLEFHRAVNELQKSAGEFPGVELSLITFGRGDNALENEFVRVARGQGLDVDIIPERGRFDLKTISRLRTLVDARTPDIVLTHSVKSHLLMWRTGLGKRIPWVAFHHGYTTTDAKMRAYNQIDRWSLPHANRVVTVCEAFARELTTKRGLSPEEIVVQHNSIRPATAVSEDAVRALKNGLGIDVNERIVLAVGRLSREKGHIDFLHAFKLLRESDSELKARLIIVGDGPERTNLKAGAASLGIADHAIFTGQVRDVETYYSMADVLVNPSHSEGSPYVLLEAMAAGVPIIATAVGGVPEILKDEESALLVPSREPRILAAAMLRLLSNQEFARDLAVSASALVTVRHSPETYARSLVGLYRDVLSTSRRRS
jgi:glycosyltransferase involved in cell wall biosynthesis